MRDISGTLNVQGIVKFLHLAEIVNAQVLLPKEEDQIIWGCQHQAMHAKSAYSALLADMAELPLWISIWRGWGAFIWPLWIVIRHWTAGRVRSGGWDYVSPSLARYGSRSSPISPWRSSAPNLQMPLLTGSRPRLIVPAPKSLRKPGLS